MVFWLAVLVGGFFAWVGVQIGFYATWIMLFNLVLSAYLAIFLSPVFIESIPAATSTPYGYALVLISIAAATLIISYGICLACLSGRLRIEFPKLLDTIAAGLLGFLAGFLVSSFLTFSISLTPLSEIDALKTLGIGASSQKTNTSYMCWWCDRLHGMVASSDTESTSEDAVDRLLARAGSPGPEAASPSTSEAAKPGTTEAPKAATSEPSKPAESEPSKPAESETAKPSGDEASKSGESEASKPGGDDEPTERKSPSQPRTENATTPAP